MTEEDQKFLNRERAFLTHEMEELRKLREERAIYRKLISPKFFFQKWKEAWKDEETRVATIVPIFMGAVGVTGSLLLPGFEGLGAKMAAESLTWGVALGTGVATAKAAFRVHRTIKKELPDFNPLKAGKKEDSLTRSIFNQQSRLRHMESFFSQDIPDISDRKGRNSAIIVVKSSSPSMLKKKKEAKEREKS